MKIKKALATILLIATTTTPAIALSIEVNGTPLTTDVPPKIISNRTFVPVANIATATGATVQWDSATKTVIITKEADELRLQIGSTTATKNGEKINLDAPAQTVNGRTLVPISFIATNLGLPVTYDPATKIVSITTNTDTAEADETKTTTEATQNQTNTNESSYPNGIPNSSETTVDADKNGVWIKGNKNSMVYHSPGGRDYNKISPKNIIWFKTAEDAKSAGFRSAEQ